MLPMRRINLLLRSADGEYNNAVIRRRLRREKCVLASTSRVRTLASDSLTEHIEFAIWAAMADGTFVPGAACPFANTSRRVYAVADDQERVYDATATRWLRRGSDGLCH
jgi:hypothetical protein